MQSIDEAYWLSAVYWTSLRKCEDNVVQFGIDELEGRLRALIEEVRFAADSLLEGTGFEPSVPRRDGIFETAPFELSGTAPSVRRAGSFARESKGSNPTSLGHLKEPILQMIVRWVGVRVTAIPARACAPIGM
jgi:hypothetical protein